MKGDKCLLLSEVKSAYGNHVRQRQFQKVRGEKEEEEVTSEYVFYKGGKEG